MPRRWLTLAFASTLAVHLAAIYWPRIDTPAAPTGTDKVVHVVLFAAPVVAAILAFRRSWPVVMLLAAHAPLSEWVQSLVLPARAGEIADIAADLAGVALGVALGVLGRRRSTAATLVD
ncbi:MAG: VanZ family protein [Actinomycetales bacterium]|nr:VanZ family protein [Candidatus Phosphoribacter baldrii]